MVLRNKLSINDAAALAREEERLSKQKAAELFEKDLLAAHEAGSFESLAFIHEQLFGEIYDFAGKLRDVNLSKGSFRFAPVLYLKESVSKIEEMPQSSFDEIIDKYVEMNVAHPFREGNGRSMRIWLDHMLRQEIGNVVDWSKVDKQDYLLAMERSPIRTTEIKVLLRDALTDRVHSREIYMKGIDASYAYEGYETFKTQGL
ncbi:protein adenylyltransferase Fic [Xiamenia xianingshaonis]|uniref:protein adenylyltransferase n=1 Tax=Xiamenia xianingshaonis TaxID=2682776 RepID=A0A9E6MRK5_9ACTN|nr:Fic family protein [Xiamenia xianingshaonis]NHM14815.1 cell filamentation protein Fic [Xiamenia xianingshaonis]QTU84778.1 Fic family protein [Xiamenia xianingshaonis]